MKIIFIDRDGVINRFPGIGKYVVTERQLKVRRNSVRALRLLTEAGYEINVISNQGCVSRGLISRKKLAQLTRRIDAAVQKGGGRIRKFFYCLHQTSDRCACKKPKIELLKRAAAGRAIPWKRTYFIGDSSEDMMTAKRAGCRGVLVLSGRVKKEGVRFLEARPYAVKKDLLEAVRWILRKKS